MKLSENDKKLIEEICYNGHKIMYVNLTNLLADQLLESLKKINKEIMPKYRDGELLTIVDFTGSFADAKMSLYMMTPESVNGFKKAKKVAYINLVGLKATFLRAFRAFAKKINISINVKVCEDVESACKYLIGKE